ncbi:MAG: RhuM family protein [Patescibacteria group bacterium]|nr:RhuM family protein [Patescibacteria group bacterium]
MKNKPIKNIAIYQTKSGAIEFRGDFEQETIWGTQKQIAEVFGANVCTINEHLKNIYKTDELEEKATIRNFRIVQQEGKRSVEREVNFYNLDTILSVGYRVSSKQAN